MVKIRHLSWLLLCLAVMVLGCEGSGGPRGPAGPAGTANVIYSDWFSPATWDLANVYGVHERSYTMTAPLLTQEIIDQGVVMVYMRFAGLYPEINQLPVVITNGSDQLNFTSRAQAGSVKAIYYLLNAPANDPVIIPNTNQVRYVLIPGGVLAAVAASEGIASDRLAGSLRGMPYREACRLFNISE